MKHEEQRELVKKELQKIKLASQDILDRANVGWGKLGGHPGICHALIDTTYPLGKERHSHFVFDFVKYVIDVQGFQHTHFPGLIGPSGEWTEERQRLCEDIIAFTERDVHIDGFMQSSIYEPDSYPFLGEIANETN